MLGELEQLVLLATLRVGADAYGVPIQRELAREGGRDLALATVYKTLARLEAKGLVRSRSGEPTPLRGGRRKRYYQLTPAGMRALQHALRTLRRLAAGLAVGMETP